MCIGNITCIMYYIPVCKLYIHSRVYKFVILFLITSNINFACIYIVSTGITTLKKGRNYIGIIESQEAAVAMQRPEMINSAVESDSDKE